MTVIITIIIVIILPMFRRVLCLFLAGALLPFSLPILADAKSVFAGASPSIVVVLAQNASGEQQAQGSGVVIGEGIAITNCHVIDNAAKVKLRQAADSRGAESYSMDAEVIAKDEDNDLCLLFAADLTQPPAAKAATMGAAKGLSIGEEVYAIGAPQGLELSLSRGIVAQLRGIKGKAPIIQTDAAISPGSSGGGLFNDDGELVGITTFKRKEGENLNFAMPVENAAALLQTARQQIAAKKAIAAKWQQCTANITYQCVFDLAMQTARQIEDASDRARALRSIAEAQAEAGDINGAKQTIDSAKQTARQIEDASSRVLALSDIAAAQAKAGDINGAKQTARQIENAYSRANALSDIAEAQAKLGDINGAKQTIDSAKQIVRQIEHALFRADALASIAAAQAKVGDINTAKQTIDSAKQTARQIEYASFRANVLGDIAEVQAEAGDINGAKQTARQIEYASSRANALGRIAVAQAESGNIEGAKQTINSVKQTARQIDGAYYRASALQSIAEAQAKWGDFMEAMQTARSIDDNLSLQAVALANIAKALATR